MGVTGYPALAAGRGCHQDGSPTGVGQGELCPAPGTVLAPHWYVGAMRLREECSGISSLVSHSPGPPTCGNVIFASPGTSFQVKNKVSQQWKGNVCYHPLIRLGGDSNNSGRSRRGSAWHPCLAGKQKLHHQHGMGINIIKKKKRRKRKKESPFFHSSRQDLLSKLWQRKASCSGALKGKMKGETYIFQPSLFLTWENSADKNR